MPAALLYSGVINTTSFTKIRQCLLAKVIYTDRETDRRTDRHQWHYAVSNKWCQSEPVTASRFIRSMNVTFCCNKSHYCYLLPQTRQCLSLTCWWAVRSCALVVADWSAASRLSKTSTSDSPASYTMSPL